MCRWCRPFLAWQVRVRSRAHVEFIARVRGPGMVPGRPNSASGLTGVRNVCRKRGTGMRAICMSKASSNTNITSNIIGRPAQFGYKELCAQWTLLNWEPDELITRYKNAGAKLFVALANHHDSFDAWDSERSSAVECGRSRPPSRCDRHRGPPWRESRVYGSVSRCIRRRATGGGSSLRMAPPRPGHWPAFPMMDVSRNRMGRPNGGRDSIPQRLYGVKPAPHRRIARYVVCEEFLRP